jgi:WD40 repeat protein
MLDATGVAVKPSPSAEAKASTVRQQHLFARCRLAELQAFWSSLTVRPFRSADSLVNMTGSKASSRCLAIGKASDRWHSRALKVLVTGGADWSVRLWLVDDGACLSTFTEFSNTIVALVFVSKSLQLVTGDSSGCLKVVRVQTGATDLEISDAHSGQIWNICPDGDGLLTCGVDGKICFWRDNTREVEKQERVAEDEAARDEQELTNALRGGEFVGGPHLRLQAAHAKQTAARRPRDK